MSQGTSEAQLLGLVVVAAGCSRRFGSNKLQVRLGGQTVLRRAVACMRKAFPAAPLVVVAPPGEEHWQEQELAGLGVSAVVAGGEARQDSVRAGVEALRLPNSAIVAIHDGARPFVPPQDVLRVVEAAQTSGAAVLAAPVVDTIKEVSSDLRVLATLPREHLMRSLTPQAYRVDLLRKAWAQAPPGVFSDEAGLLESLGMSVRVVLGDPRNAKLTRPEDVSFFRGLFPPDLRVGQGVDVHPFAPGRKLVLAGVEIPWDMGLAGHSDADVVLHAVTDAILAACGEGDIGEHFPPSDPRWSGACSSTFLAFALERAQSKGLVLLNCSVTLLAEKPKLAPWKQAIRQRLGELLAVGPDGVNVAATTTEAMGFVGRGEGVVALAVVLLGRE